MSDDPRIISIGPKRIWVFDPDLGDGYWATMLAAEATGNDGRMHGMTCLLADDICAEMIDNATKMLRVALFNQMHGDGVWEIDAAPAQSP